MERVAKSLCELYGESFGGKQNGRYRIPSKLVAEMAGRRRLYEDDIKQLTRALLEEGFVLVDMETFYVILSAKTFTNYRRANAEVIAHCLDEAKPRATLN
ncbi:MAG: hypothetical protein ACE37E_16580 [Hyphomicrobiales bacterium]|jgi:hypothetical protein